MADIPPIIAWEYQFAPNGILVVFELHGVSAGTIRSPLSQARFSRRTRSLSNRPLNQNQLTFSSIFEAQKSRNYLYATNTPFKICEQPFVIPRPDLLNLGITYRRVPVLSIGKDVFCDNTSFIDAMQQLLGAKGLKTSSSDRAWEAWGYRTFWICLPCVPADLITEDLGKDRKDLFPVFARKDFATLRQNGLSELRSLLDTAEHEFLSGNKPFVNGQSLSLADIHANWMIKWAFHTIGVSKEAGFDKSSYPKTYAWCESTPTHDDEIQKGAFLTGEEATKQILSSQYALPEIGVDSTDPLGFKGGEDVAIEMTDATPGYCPQNGKLVGLSKSRIVVQVENGLRVHFPRIGYVVKSQKGGAATNGHA